MTEDVRGQASEPALAFGPFQLLPRARVLLHEGHPVRLGSRGFELLSLLVERAGEVVPHEALIQRAWPTTTVTEQNLRVQITALRKVLTAGDRPEIILNVPGRGYQCLARVTLGPAVVGDQASARSAPSDLPALLTEVYGRSEVLAELASRLAHERLVSLVGPGGVGKTTVAIAAAQACRSDHVWFVDLAPLVHDGLIPATIAAALGQPALADDSLAGLRTFLRDKHALIVLDNCEHLVGACAEVAEALLRAAPNLRILATSREPLKCAGEGVCRLSGLATPPDGTVGRTAALGFAAVQLFLDRAASRPGGFHLAETDVAVVNDLCRQLDGLPLALELTAARVGVLGLRETADRLRARWVASAQARPGPARHAALTAALDWSFDLLSSAEQRLLRRLSVFSSSFTLASALAVGGADGEGDATAGELEALVGLVDKSLVNVDLSAEPVRYRLLQMTRDYAAAKLDAAELIEVRARHAQQHRVLLRQSDTGWSFERGSEWIPIYAAMVDDVRAAFDWALSPSGDLGVAVDLAVESLPLWHGLSLAQTYIAHLHGVLERVRSQSPTDPGTEMRLLGALGVANTFVGHISRETIDDWTKVRTLAVARSDTDHQLLALWGLWFGAVFPGALKKAQEFAVDFATLAETQPNLANRALAQHMLAYARFSAGELSPARAHVERGLALFAQTADDWGIARTWFDPVVLLHALLTKILWLQGQGEQAQAAARLCVQVAQRHGHAFSMSFALVEAGVQIPLLNGDFEEAERAVAEHLRQAEAFALDDATLLSNMGMAGLLCAARGDPAGAAPLLVKALAGDFGFAIRFPAVIGRLAEALAHGGDVSGGRRLLDGILATVARDPKFWCQPELQRALGVLARQAGGAKCLAEAEAYFQAALDQARAQGALAWELRIATDLAELWRDTGRAAAAGDLLEPVVGRFTEGFALADFRRAAHLQADLGVRRPAPPALHTI